MPKSIAYHYVCRESFAVGEGNFPSLSPEFRRRISINIFKDAQMHLLLLQRKKINLSPIFSVLKLYAKIWHLFQDGEIGETLVFFALQ